MTKLSSKIKIEPLKKPTSRILTVDRISGMRTARVFLTTSAIHPLYKKRYAITSRTLVDTGELEVKVGDRVRIVETKPISKRKSWRVIEIITNKDIK